MGSCRKCTVHINETMRLMLCSDERFSDDPARNCQRLLFPNCNGPIKSLDSIQVGIQGCLCKRLLASDNPRQIKAPRPIRSKASISARSIDRNAVWLNALLFFSGGWSIASLFAGLLQIHVERRLRCLDGFPGLCHGALCLLRVTILLGERLVAFDARHLL